MQNDHPTASGGPAESGISPDSQPSDVTAPGALNARAEAPSEPGARGSEPSAALSAQGEAPSEPGARSDASSAALSARAEAPSASKSVERAASNHPEKANANPAPVPAKVDAAQAPAKPEISAPAPAKADAPAPVSNAEIPAPKPDKTANPSAVKTPTRKEAAGPNAAPAPEAQTALRPRRERRGTRGSEDEKPIRPALVALAIAVLAYAALFLLMARAITPEQYDLKAGEVSARTITASKDVTDTLTTNMLIEAAVREVAPSYQSDESVMPDVLSKLEDSFAQLRALAQLRVGLDGTVAELTDEVRRKDALAMRPVEMSDAALTAALNADDETLSDLAIAAVALTREAMNAKVAEGQEKETAQKIGRDLEAEGFDSELAEAAGAIVTAYLKANMLLDEETTELKRQAARESVEDVVYKKGQNIVRAGEVVTAPQIEMLNSLGMLKDRGVDLPLYLGLALLLALLSLILILYIHSFIPDMLTDPRRVGLLSLILVSTVAWALAFRAVNAYLMPVALGAMLTTMLLKPRLALVVNIVLSILMGLMATVDSGMFTATMFGVMLTAMAAGSMVVPVLRFRHSLSGVMLSGAIVVLVNMLTTVAVGLINSADIQNVMTWALWSGGGGFISAVLTILEALLLEWAFNLVTPSKLMDLSNPNQPLLRRLLLETPGTYHHSILVANLAEAAACQVGANALLARVGAYYHDIGKLKRPLYFKENQMNDNPHDRTDPRVSTAILTAHPHDGVEMAIKAHLPEEIQEIILQHHGDSPVLYFYDKASKQGGDVDVADFRYDGPRPRSREAAIVMLADTVEAAARAAADASPEKLPLLIRKMIHGKLEDGQFDECPLTFSDLAKISEAFVTVLTGVYHDRIEYPEVVIPSRPQAPRRPWADTGREPNDEPKRADT